MRIESLLGHTAQLLQRAERNPLQAEAVVENYFRSRKYLGAKDRRFIAEIFYFLLRNYLWFSHLLETAVAETDQSFADLLRQKLVLPSKNKVRGAHLFLVSISWILHPAVDGQSQSKKARALSFLSQFFSISETELEKIFQHILQHHTDGNHHLELHHLSKRYSTSFWIVQQWNRIGYTEEEIAQILAALDQPAPIGIRVNTLKTSREKLAEWLQREEIPAVFSKLSPHGLRIEQRVNLLNHHLYRDGYFEIQDEGSQLIAFAVAPEPHWNILDACAGAGGKSLHLAALQQNRGKILATDTEPRRIAALRKRALRASASSIEAVPIHGYQPFAHTLPYPLRFMEKRFHAVLIDAPCSGLGRARRSPATKWHTKEKTVQKLSYQQLDILETYSQCVAPGGILVYATCSLLPEENENVVSTFLEKHPEFTPDPLLPAFATYNVHLPFLSSEQWFFTLLPSMAGTDGFFIARMKRIAN